MKKKMNTKIRLKINLPPIMWSFLIISAVGYIMAVLCKSVSASLYFAYAFMAACMCGAVCMVSLRYIDVVDLFWLSIFIVITANVNVYVGRNMHTGTTMSEAVDYFGKVLRFDITVMLMYICTRYKAKKSVITCFQIFTQILIMQLIYQGYVVGETYYIYTSLTLGFPNPNQGGIYAAICFLNVLWCLSCSDSKIMRLIYVVEMCILFDLLLRTGCRSGVLSVVGVIGLTILAFVRTKRHSKVWRISCYKIWGVAIFIFPFIFPVMYLGLFYANVKIGMVGGQKFYSGREILWYKSLLALKEHCIIGAYNEVSLGTGQSQLHNIYIDVLCSYGIVVFVLFLWYILWIVIKQAKKISTIQQHIAFSAFMMMFFIGGTYEAAYVEGSMAINYWPCLYLLLINTNIFRKDVGKTRMIFRYVREK